MRIHVTTPVPEMVPGFDSVPFSSAGTVLLFDWTDLSAATAHRFIARVDSGSAVFTPEASYWPAGPAEVGDRQPQPFSLAAGQCYGDPYGIDELRPFWRLWAAGTATGVFGVRRIPRT